MLTETDLLAGSIQQENEILNEARAIAEQRAEEDPTRYQPRIDGFSNLLDELAIDE